MHFTIIFHSHESFDLSYSLLFIPGPVFVKGKQELINMAKNSPYYQKGNIEKLIKKERIEKYIANDRKSVIVVHETGHATETDLKSLEKDLKDNNFKVKTVYM